MNKDTISSSVNVLPRRIIARGVGEVGMGGGKTGRARVKDARPGFVVTLGKGAFAMTKGFSELSEVTVNRNPPEGEMGEEREGEWREARGEREGRAVGEMPVFSLGLRVRFVVWIAGGGPVRPREVLRSNS